MQITAAEFLPIAEKAGALAFLDIEASNLKADFGTVVVASIKPFGKRPRSWSCRPGDDKGLVAEVRNALSDYPVWCTFYGKLFDIPFINSRLLVHGLEPLPKHHHIDCYWVVKARTALSRRNQAHLLSWLGTPESKMSVSPNVWAEMPVNAEHLDTLVKRCESDVRGLEALYRKTKHLISEITR